MKNPFSDITLQSDRITGIFRGVVERNDSPDKDGRCQIRVFGVHCPDKVKSVPVAPLAKPEAV